MNDHAQQATSAPCAPVTQKSSQKPTGGFTARQKSWAKIVGDWQKSELTKAGFCRQRGISMHLLDYYRKKLQTETREGQKLMPISVVNDSTLRGTGCPYH